MTDQQEKTVCSTFGGGAYQQALNNLEKDYEASFGYNKQRKIFEEFTRKFTTIPEIWIKWFELEADYNRKHRIDDLRKQALTHFYSLDFIGFLRPDTTIVKEFSKLIEWPYLDILRFKCYHINPSTLAEGLALAEKALTFPHWKLEEIYKIYSTKKEVSEDVKKNYRYSKFLMHLLTKAAGDDEKWFRFLRMGRNTEFIIQNIEYKICKTPWNVRLWRLYMGYLKDTKNVNLLNVYSRFCRFFIDDKEILGEYRNEIQEMQKSGKPVTKWWIDTLDFEIDFGTSSSVQWLFRKALSCKVYDPEFFEYASKFGQKYGLNKTEIDFLLSKQTQSLALIPLKGNNNDEAEENEEEEDFAALSSFYKPWGQRFSIPSSIIFYILEASDHPLLSKLFGTCKLFYSKFKVILCHGLIINNFVTRGFSPSGSSTELEINQLINIYITNSLTVNLDTNRNMLLWLRAALYRCDCETLNLYGQDIRVATLQFFIKNVTNITLSNCNISKENGEILPLQDVIALFPNADKMKFVGNNFNPQTSTNLAEVERPTKIKSFSIYNVPQTFTAANFALFVKKNAAPSATFLVYFHETVAEMMKHDFLFNVRHEIMQITENPPKVSVF